MCKKSIYLTCFVLVLACFLSSSVHAYTIIWVSDWTTGTGQPAQWDKGWADLLIAQVYTVDNRSGQYWRNLDATKIATLNAADLVIISRDAASGSYDDGTMPDYEPYQWNSVKTPMILLSVYIARSSHWRWLDTTALTGDGGAPICGAVLTSHPVFNGVTLVSNQVDVLDETVGTGHTSFMNVANAGNGTVIATRPTVSNYVWIAEWRPGQRFYSTAAYPDGTPAVAGARRMLFTAGTREGGSFGQGMYNLTAEGQKMFLNAVNYMITYKQLKAYEPNPADGTKDVKPSSLTWSAGDTAVAHDVYFGTDATAVTNATTSSTEYREQKAQGEMSYYPGSLLLSGTTHYWRIDEIEEGDTVIKGDVWSFTTPSTKAYSPSPADGARWQDPNVNLSWSRGFSVKTTNGHDVYFGTDATAVANADTSTAGIFIGNQSGTTYDLPTLAMETFYYWRIDERNTDATVAKGDVWSFQTTQTAKYIASVVRTGSTEDPPVVALPLLEDALCYVDRTHQYNSFPAELPDMVEAEYIKTANDDKGNSTLTHQVTLSKAATIYLILDNRLGNPAGGYGVVPNLVGMPWVATLGFVDTGYDIGIDESGDGSINNWSSLFMTGFQAGTITLGGNTEGHGGNMYGIVATAPPVKARNPRPANNALIETMTVTLQWDAGFSAASTNGHKVYFSDSFDDVNERAVTPVVRTDLSYQIPTLLQLGKTYYWAVDEVNNLHPDSPWKGNVWSFRVTDYLVVDDFESYTNTSPNIVCETWKDGLGFGGPGNGTGSQAGYRDPNYAEIRVIHGGRQSMPVDYDNTKLPYYSEADRTFGAPQDWTISGVKALTLWLRGYPAVPAGTFVESPPGTYTMTATGTDIWNVPNLRNSGYHDEFHYVYTQANGDCWIAVKVESVGNTDPWAKAGIMIRDSADESSAHVMACITPANGVRLQYRTITGGPSTSDGNDPNITAPYWLALERVGDLFIASYSIDGSSTSWSEFGRATVVMYNPVCIGLSLTSHNAAAVCTAVFSNVSTSTGTTPSTWTSVDIGIKSNTAAPLYVTLQDSGNNSARVTSTDPNIALSTTYQAWDIALNDFKVANPSLNLGGIKKITIGVGNRAAPVLDGKGTIYVDDIRLYLPRCMPDHVKPAADFTDDCLVEYADLDILTNNWLVSTYDVTPAPPGAANLEAYYRFEGDLQDSSGKGRHGDPCATTPSYAAGKAGQALVFSGDDYIYLGNSFNLPLYSVALWFRVDGGTDSRDLFTLFTTNHGVLLEVQAAGTLRYLHRFPFGTGGGTNIYTTAGYADGLWHHAAAVKSADRMVLYVDGLQVGAQTDNTQFDQVAMAVLGRIDNARAERYFTGAMDDVQIYSRVLSQNEVAYLAGKTTPFTQPLETFLTPQDPAINVYNDKIIDFRDYVILADMWLEEILWPQ